MDLIKTAKKWVAAKKADDELNALSTDIRHEDIGTDLDPDTGEEFKTEMVKVKVKSLDKESNQWTMSYDIKEMKKNPSLAELILDKSVTESKKRVQLSTRESLAKMSKEMQPARPALKKD